MTENKIKEISEKTDPRTLLEQIAEEAAEVSQAALKLIRAKGLNSSPTPCNPDSAYETLVKEMTDLMVVWGVFACDKSFDEFIHEKGDSYGVIFIGVGAEEKINRWHKRISKSEKA